MTDTPDENLSDEDMTTAPEAGSGPGIGDADGTDSDSDGIDSDSDGSDSDSDGTDGDASDSSDGDAGDGDII